MKPSDLKSSSRVLIRGLFSGRIGTSLLSILLAFGTATLFIALFGFEVGEGYQAMIRGAFGSPVAIADTLARATPLIFTGLGVAIGLRAGLFNVGIEGQMLMGALAASQVGLIGGLSGWIHIPLVFISAIVAGALCGIIPAILKSRFRAHEVITTIMLNYVVILFTGYMANYPLHAEGDMMPATVRISESVQLARLVPGGQLTLALFVAIGAAIALKFFIDSSVYGYEIRAVGLNPQAAEAKGISRERAWIIAMGIGGAMAGLAGAGEVMGIHRRFIQGFSPGYGFDGIAVALMGYSDPLGVVFSALILGAIRTGAMVMDRTTRIPVDFVVVIQGLVLLFLAMPGLMDLFKRRRIKRPTYSPDIENSEHGTID